MISPMSSSGAAITMAVLADKVQRGTRLTDAELNIAITNAAQIYSGAFGPMPEELRLLPMQLPENVKGILASFSL